MKWLNSRSSKNLVGTLVLVSVSGVLAYAQQKKSHKVADAEPVSAGSSTNSLMK